MPVHLVFTVIAPDKPGIVELLSHTVGDHGANWLGSRMARLSGEFAGIVEISVPETSVEDLGKALTALEKHGMDVQIKRSDVDADRGAATQTLRLELVGDDRPGIVREVSQALTRRGVNVDELETSCESAPMSGEPLFRARARLQLPQGVTAESLRDELEKIADELMVDLTLDKPA